MSGDHIFVLRNCGQISLYNRNWDSEDTWKSPSWEGDYPKEMELKDWELNAIAEIYSLAELVGIKTPLDVPWTSLISCIRGDYTGYYDTGDEDYDNDDNDYDDEEDWL